MSQSGAIRVPLLLGLVAVLGVLVYLDRADAPAPPVAEARRASPGSPSPIISPSLGTGPRTEVAAADRTLNPLSRVPLSNLNDTMMRPLFEPSRRSQERPPPPPPAPTPQAAPPPRVVPASPAEPEVPNFRLVGVVSGPGRTIAVIAKAGTPPMRVETGDVVEGWEIARIMPTEVTLSRGGRQVALSMFRR